MKRIKNTTNADKLWLGQVVESGQYFTIESQEEIKWANDSILLADIGNGSAVVNNGTSDITDINNAINFLKDIELTDADGRTLVRSVAAKAGWTYFMCPVEFTTSKLNSIYCKKYDDSNRSIVTYKIYDSNNTEITDAQYETNAVKTVLDIEPVYDYEIIGGQLQQYEKPTTDLRLWVIGVPDVPEAYGGTKEMVGGINLRYIDPTDKVHADGRVSKYMPYNATYHTNKIRLIFRHNAGTQHNLMMVFEIFKA